MASPEFQVLLDVVYGALMVSIGFILNGFRTDIKAISDRQSELERYSSETYARRDMVGETFIEIRGFLTRIEDKIDRKADKSG
jgi:hypothetical protein